MAEGGQVKIELSLLTDKAKKQLKQFKEDAVKAGAPDKSAPYGRDMTGKPLPAPVISDVSAAGSRAARLEELRRYRIQGLRGFNAQEFFRSGQFNMPRRAGLMTPPDPRMTEMSPERKAQLDELRRLRTQGLRGFNVQQFFREQQEQGRKGGQTIGGMINNVLNAKLSTPQAAFVKITSALAAMRVAVGLASWTFNTLLAPLRIFNRAIGEGAESARRLYAKSLSSGGMPLGFTQMRASLAQVLGVGEQEVFQYGKQVAYLNAKLEQGNRVIVRHNLTLTETAWKTSILQNNWKALMTSMVADLAPLKNAITDFLGSTVEKVTTMREKKRDDRARFDAMAKYAQEQGLGLKAPATFMGGPAGDISKAYFTKQGKENKEAMTAFIKQWKTATANIPLPETSARRYQTSPWERMGLVIGMGAADNPARKTALNTAKMVEQLNRMIEITQRTKPEMYRKLTGATNP